MKKSAVLIGFGIALLMIQCKQQQQPSADTRVEDAAAIRQADIDWLKAVETQKMEGHLEYYLEDVVLLAPNEARLDGKEAVRKMLTDLHSMPGLMIKWQPLNVEAASSGDMGYSIGTYEMSMNDPDGNPMKDKGKYLAVWKKQADGSWKVATESFNSDLPLPQPQGE